MASVFTSLVVYTLAPDQTLVEWTLHDSFRLVSPYTFTLQFSRSSSNVDAEWIDVGTQVVSPSTTYSVTDNVQRFASTTARTGFYRVKLSDGASQTYYSHIEPTWGGLSRADRLLVRELYRQECLRLTKRAGTSGFLYHSRQHGPKAPKDNRSIDYVIGDVLDPESDAAVGTRFTGGYWSPVPYLVEVTTPLPRTSKVTPAGNDATVKVRGRALAYPVPMSGDIWHSCVTGRRYHVISVDVVAAVRSVPVIVQLQMGEIPPGHVVYDLEIP